LPNLFHGTVFTFPESMSAMRRAISSSQAFSGPFFHRAVEAGEQGIGQRRPLLFGK